MKKKIFSIVFVAAIAVAATWNISLSKAEVLSDIALTNVEALAGCETTFGSCWENGYICCNSGFIGCAPCGY